MTFLDRTEKGFIKSVKTGIEEFLKYLNSNIELPLDKEGNVNETKLANVVESREDCVNSVYALMDEINSKEKLSKSFESKIISGLEKTYYGLLEIIERPMPRLDADDPITDDDIKNLDTEEFYDKVGNQHQKNLEKAIQALLGGGKPNYTDDKIKSIAKAKRVATKVCNGIRTRITQIQDSEIINKQKVENKRVVSIPERMVQMNGSSR